MFSFVKNYGNSNRFGFDKQMFLLDYIYYNILYVKSDFISILKNIYE